MKLTRIPGTEATVKHSFSFKQSTTNLLQLYQLFYSKETGCEVPLKDIVEQMILDFMSEDKAFSKFSKQEGASARDGARFTPEKTATSDSTEPSAEF